MAKTKTRSKIILSAALIAFVLIGTIVSIVLVFAAETQETSSSIKLSFTATDVAGTVKFSYCIAGGEFSEEQTLDFNGFEDTDTSDFGPNSSFTLTREAYYVVFKYEILGRAENGFNVSMQYLDQLDADFNNRVDYAISSSEISDFSTLGRTSSVGTILSNHHGEDEQTLYLYVKVSVADIVDHLNMDGDLVLVLSKNEWVDPNYDETTGMHFGLVDNNGSPYAVVVGYDGSATEVTINSTSVYGGEMPVVVVGDYAFSPSIATAATTAITKVTMGENVERINGYAFAYNTSLTDATISNWVKKIMPTAFYGCTGLNKITNKSPVKITASKFSLPATTVIDEPLAVRVEDETFNGRKYYYVEMGEYPQTYAGAATTELSTTGEKFVCDMSVATSSTSSTFTQGKEYDIYEDVLGFRYIKHTVKPYSTSYTYMDSTVISAVEAYFKLEPIKWDIVGYYNNDKTDFTRASDDDFDPNHTTNLVVTSRTALQAMAWYPTNTDVDYNASSVYKWLRTFETNVLSQYKDTNIQQVTNNYNDTNETSWSEITSNTAPTAGSVEEYAWVMDYTQANTLFASNNERKSSPSDFALATYAYMNTSYDSITRTGTCYSWLRSSSLLGSYYGAGLVDFIGSFSNSYVYGTSYAVRPCVLINL